jgi:hypothetical protein
MKIKNWEQFNENVSPEIKQEILDYISEKYPEEWWNDEKSNRVYDYFTEEDMIGDGTEEEPEYETLEDVYDSHAMGGAIEYDLMEIISDDVMEKFNIDKKSFYDDDYDYIIQDYMKDTISWYDRFVFNESDKKSSDGLYGSLDGFKF